MTAPATDRTLHARLAEDAAERLVRYAQIDTQSDEDSDTFPSTPKQLDLLRLLRDELEALGLDDVELTSTATSSRPSRRRSTTTCRPSASSPTSTRARP